MMTEATTPGQEPPEAPETTPDAAEAPEHPGREAARYRTRLREVESERDAVAGRLTAYQRRAAESAAAQHLSRASDLWLDGVDVADLLDDAGDVDPERVALAVKGVLDGRPQLAPRVADHGGGRRQTPASPASWADVIRSRKR